MNVVRAVGRFAGVLFVVGVSATIGAVVTLAVLGVPE